MHTKLAALLVSAGTLSGFSAGLCAQQPDQRGWYAGGAIGVTQTKIDDGVLPIGGSTASSLSKDESATVWGLAVGYDINRHWALEGGYANNGKFTARRTSTAGTVGTFGGQSKGDAIYFAGIGKLPLQNNFYLFGKLGLAATNAKTHLDTTGAVPLPNGVSETKKSEANLLWGLGAGYNFTRNVSVRFDYTQIHDVGDRSTGEGDVNTFTVGLRYHF